MADLLGFTSAQPKLNNNGTLSCLAYDSNSVFTWVPWVWNLKLNTACSMMTGKSISAVSQITRGLQSLRPVVNFPITLDMLIIVFVMMLNKIQKPAVSFTRRVFFDKSWLCNTLFMWCVYLMW